MYLFYLALSIVCFFIARFVSLHFLLGVVVGFAWTYFNILQIQPGPRMVSKLRINNGKYSFLNFVVFLDISLNRMLNSTEDIKKASMIRVLTPVFFFLIIVAILNLRIHWWWILTGSALCEFYFVYGGRDKFLKVLERLNVSHEIRKFF